VCGVADDVPCCALIFGLLEGSAGGGAEVAVDDWVRGGSSSCSDSNGPCFGHATYLSERFAGIDGVEEAFVGRDPDVASERWVDCDVTDYG